MCMLAKSKHASIAKCSETLEGLPATLPVKNLGNKNVFSFVMVHSTNKQCFGEKRIGKDCNS